MIPDFFLNFLTKKKSNVKSEDISHYTHNMAYILRLSKFIQFSSSSSMKPGLFHLGFWSIKFWDVAWISKNITSHIAYSKTSRVI